MGQKRNFGKSYMHLVKVSIWRLFMSFLKKVKDETKKATKKVSEEGAKLGKETKKAAEKGAEATKKAGQSAVEGSKKAVKKVEKKVS